MDALPVTITDIRVVLMIHATWPAGSDAFRQVREENDAALASASAIIAIMDYYDMPPVRSRFEYGAPILVPRSTPSQWRRARDAFTC